MLRINARAKINVTLDITGVRDDGYHLMDMLMTSVALHDTLILTAADSLTLEIVKPPLRPDDFNTAAVAREDVPSDAAASPVPANENNLVLRAARALLQAVRKDYGAHMQLKKHIPVGAGMGGGSADAAAALVGLNTLWALGLPNQTLAEIGLTIGADVPFMLTGGFARVCGIGEIIDPLPAPPPLWLVIAQPCDGLSTPEIFRAFDAEASLGIHRPNTQTAQCAFVEGNIPLLCKAMGNVMEPISILKRPQIGDCISKLESTGALKAMMTGSGSAVFGIFENEKKARNAYTALRNDYERLYLTHTDSRGISLQQHHPK